MRKLFWLFAFLLIIGFAGCRGEGPFEEAGEAVDDTIENVGDAAEGAGDAIEDATD